MYRIGVPPLLDLKGRNRVQERDQDTRTAFREKLSPWKPAQSEAQMRKLKLGNWTTRRRLSSSLTQALTRMVFLTSFCLVGVSGPPEELEFCHRKNLVSLCCGDPVGQMLSPELLTLAFCSWKWGSLILSNQGETLDDSPRISRHFLYGFSYFSLVVLRKTSFTWCYLGR